MVKLLIFGPTGSMGTLISKLAIEDPEIEVVAACDLGQVGKSLGEVLGVESSKDVLIKNIGELESLIDDTNPEVAVDFTIAEATEKNGLICAQKGIKCVIGTTGLSEEFMIKLKEIIKQKSVPYVISSNMATGVNIFFKMASILAAHLSDWDIEIIEAHHHRKRDSPSGTALTTGKIISETLGVNFNDVAKFGRSLGPNKREIGAKKEIGIHSIRGGDIVGDHTILFAGPGERIELKHQAHSRDCFATGAIKAIKFLADKSEGKIYDMSEVLGL